MQLQFVLHFYRIKHHVAPIYVTSWQGEKTCCSSFCTLLHVASIYVTIWLGKKHHAAPICVTLLQNKTPCCSNLCYNLTGKNTMLLQSVLHFYRTEHHVAPIYVIIWQEKTPCCSNLCYTIQDKTLCCFNLCYKLTGKIRHSNLTGKNTMLLQSVLHNTG